MKKNSMVLIVLLIVGAIYGQIISLSQTEVNFGQVNIATESFVDLVVTNETSEDLTVDVAENSDILEVDQASFLLPANATYSVHVSVTPETNIVYDNTIFFIVNSTEYTVPVKINVGGRIPDSTYNSTYNKWDSDLKNALSSIISNNNSISYEDARIELFGYISNENGQVRCVYTNEYYSCSPGGIPNWNSINTEHTWPQSMGATGNAKSDLHHLFPTNSQANSIRGNYPFGIVANASWQEGGSKKGSNSSGSTVFEPRDDHKGDTARALFYFALRYNNPNNFLNSANQQMVLRDWYYDDPVSQYEIHRNEEIKEIQNKPNPFIEYPMLLDRIANITHDVTTPRFPEVFVPLAEYHFPETELNETSTIYIPVTNSGDTSLSISSITFTNSAYQVGDYPSSLEIGDWGLIAVEFTPTEDIDYPASMQINSNTNPYNVSLVSGGLVVSNSTDVESLTTLTLNNYPNPFTAKTTLKVHGLKENNVSIDIFNVRGQRVNTIKTNSVRGGNSSVTWNGKDLNGENLSSGLYFVKIQSAGQSVTKKILMMK